MFIGYYSLGSSVSTDRQICLQLTTELHGYNVIPKTKTKLHQTDKR